MIAMTEALTNTSHNALGGAASDSQWDNLHEIKNAVVINTNPWIAKVKEDTPSSHASWKNSGAARPQPHVRLKERILDRQGK